MDDSRIDRLKLENQICFPLYACSKEIVRKYKPHLDKLNLTYTQYITMLVLWEKKELNVKELGKQLFLDSGTLTPVLKKLEQKGYVNRNRSTRDERNLIVSITEKGERLRSEAAEIPLKIEQSVDFSGEDCKELYRLLYKLMGLL
ncbi:MAG: MarR family transcriptional regulator [Eubacterium sp.]|nr:MarR family transcriptional regulator [Eubacterium sp.]